MVLLTGIEPVAMLTVYPMAVLTIELQKVKCIAYRRTLWAGFSCDILGGDGGIRTHASIARTGGLVDRSLQPLGYVSIFRGMQQIYCLPHSRYYLSLSVDTR